MTDTRPENPRAVVSMVTMFQAVCTCGWKQLRKTDNAAQLDADRHNREWHGQA